MVKNINTKEIISLTGIHPLKVKNVYLYGSRVYGTAEEQSDYDFIVVASSLNEATEIRKKNFNIHIHTPDKFRKDLFDHDIKSFECIFAPDFARLQEKVQYNDKNFILKPKQLKYKLMSQSFWSFKKAKKNINGVDDYIGLKSLFHSLRILDFGIQILKYGTIKDFSSANWIWNEIKDSEEDWEVLKERYLPIKVKMEKEFKGL